MTKPIKTKQDQIKLLTKNAYDIAGLAGCQRHNHGKLEAYKWALSIIKDFDVDQECIKALSDKVSRCNLVIEKTEKEIGKLGGDIVRYNNGELWLVKWHRPSASFLLFQIIENGANQILSGIANNINAHELEVISNVHDSKFLKLSNSRELE